MTGDRFLRDYRVKGPPGTLCGVPYDSSQCPEYAAGFQAGKAEAEAAAGRPPFVILPPEIRPLIDGPIPRCIERCPSHDGKRCGLLGHKPYRICQPAIELLGTEWKT